MCQSVHAVLRATMSRNDDGWRKGVRRQMKRMRSSATDRCVRANGTTALAYQSEHYISRAIRPSSVSWRCSDKKHVAVDSVMVFSCPRRIVTSVDRILCITGGLIDDFCCNSFKQTADEFSFGSLSCHGVASGQVRLSLRFFVSVGINFQSSSSCRVVLLQ